jgi:hypothetical protein
MKKCMKSALFGMAIMFGAFAVIAVDAIVCFGAAYFISTPFGRPDILIGVMWVFFMMGSIGAIDLLP